MRTRSALVAVALLVSSCTSAVATPGTPTTTASATVSAAPPTARAASPSPSASLVPEIAVEFDARGFASGAIPLADRVIWMTTERIDADHVVSRILDRSLATGATRVLYETGTGVQRLSGSARWLIWIEAADVWNLSDAKVYAMAVDGGPRILVADPLRAPDFWGRFFDAAVVDDDVYWTVPREIGGVWRGELYRRRLPDGDAQLVTAVTGSHIGWPVGRTGELLYQQTEQGGYPTQSDHPGPPHVMRRLPDGTTTKLADGSFPTVSSTFIAYLDGTDSRPTALMPDGRTVTFGGSFDPGYPLVASGDWAMWGDGFFIHVARPRDGCVKHYSNSSYSPTNPGSVYTPLGIGPTYAAVQRAANDGTQRTIGLIDLAKIRCP